MPSSSLTYDLLQDYVWPYQIFLIINCVIICILYPLFMLSIQYSDKKLNTAYKSLFFCCATTSLITSICQVLYAPVLTPRFFGIVVTGIAKDLGDDTNLWFFQIAVIMLTNSQLCALALLIFQFSHLTPNCMWSKLGKNTNVLLLFYLAYLSCMITVVVVVTRYASTSKSDFAMFVQLTDNNFGKELIIHQETYFAFISKYNSASYALASIGLFSIVFICFAGFYYTFILSKVICNTRKHVSDQTYKLEMAMFRTFIFKTGMMFCFYFIPFFVYGISLWIDVECPLLLIFINVFYVSHGWISYVVSFFFIGPYRKVISKLIKHKFSTAGFSSSSTSVAPSDQRILSIKNLTITKSNS